MSALSGLNRFAGSRECQKEGEWWTLEQFKKIHEIYLKKGDRLRKG